MGIILEGIVRLLHQTEVGMNSHLLPSVEAPRLRDQLAAELQNEAEDAMYNVHHRGSLHGQQTSNETKTMLNVVAIIYGPQEEKNRVTILYISSLVALKNNKSTNLQPTAAVILRRA